MPTRSVHVLSKDYMDCIQLHIYSAYEAAHTVLRRCSTTAACRWLAAVL
jgi:hypothetical protein